MTAATENASAGGGWRRLAALLLALIAVGLPVNAPGSYALLLIAAVVLFSGEVSARGRAWAAAVATVAVAVAVQFLLAPPRIEEGHNVFLPDAPVLQRGLPADVYREIAHEFDALYPPAVRCKPGSTGCWQDEGRPDRLYAFSADGIWHKSAASRAVTSLDFSDPVWLRLGFTNQLKYNWYSAAPDVHRADRDRRFWMGLRRWHLAMPWFEMVRLPAAYAGGELCWRGEVQWEGADERFTRWPGGGCRAIEPADAGRRVFGIAIAPDTLAMRLTPPWPVQIRKIAADVFAAIAVLALLCLLVRVRARRLLLPAILIALLIAGVGRALFPDAHESVAFGVLILSISLSGWVQYARTVRGSTLVERHKEYVQAARVTGVAPLRIMTKHVLPNVMGPVLVLATIQVATAIITEATLSFLGVGAPPTSPSLGTLIRTGNDFLFSGEWWITIWPSAMLVLIALSVNLLGDWLRDALNPKLR